ncbi:MAG: chromosomal replication initiator protein DnaA [Proteobacteria bacterium]|nr:chromosomal replication initiator protein DnaA [Desulfobacula sp.]MBU3953638.1 chromosomal replication initiator protein DnaA [Pseudomonadota bacterium]MBU4132403.1 chromosomal replication initiator protein DnaA [Pseudomonadota bacterium]
MELSWEKVKFQIKKSIPDHSYRMWIEPLALIDYDATGITLATPNDFFVKRIKDNYLDIFQREFSNLGQSVTIEFQTSGKKEAKGFPIDKELNIKLTKDPEKSQEKDKYARAYPALAARPRWKKPEQATLPGLDASFNGGRMLKKGYTFDDFVVGDNSNFAYSASLSLAQGKINGAGILYLLGKTGLGKSHLSQAVGHHMMTNNISNRVYYVTAEDFTNEMIFSIRNQTIDQFKEKYRKKCDVLILEDIHFLSGKVATQKELAITLDYLLDADKKIIFSGCELPEDIPKLNDQLKSRLSMGLVTEIEAPDYKTRLRILKKKSTTLGCKIPRPVSEYIAQELCDDVRQLESGLFGVVAKGQIMGCNIDIALAKSVLDNITKNRKRISIDLIKQLVCTEFSISEKDIMSKSRKRTIVKPRQVAMFLAKKYTDQPIKKIGSSFKKYHATAIYSVNTIEKELKQKGLLFEQINYISKKIEAGKF